MKALFILVLVFILLIPQSAESQGLSSIEIFCDDTRGFMATCEILEGYAALVDIYIWIYHPWLGYNGAAFAVDYPEIVQPVDTFHMNENIGMGFFGDLENGIEISTGGNCLTGWNWLVKQKIMITETEWSLINIVPHSDPLYEDRVVYSVCGGGVGEFDYSNPFIVNYPEYGPCFTPTDLIVGNDSNSWGAIKKLFLTN